LLIFFQEEGRILGKVHGKKEMKGSRRKLGGNVECIWLSLCPLPVGVLDGVIIGRIRRKKKKEGPNPELSFLYALFLAEDGQLHEASCRGLQARLWSI
jgi:hypothetical protein